MATMERQQHSARQCTSWNDLPLELIIQIANELPVREALALAATASLYHRILTDMVYGKWVNKPGKGDRLLLWTIEHSVLTTAIRVLRLGVATNWQKTRAGAAQRHLRNSMPLMKAIQKKNPEMVKLLLQHGADVLTQTEEDTTLTLAVRQGSVDIAAQLLEHAAVRSTSADNGKTAATLRDLRGTRSRTTALHHAANMGHIKALELLLGHGVDKEIRDGNDQTPLHVAAKMGRIASIELLLRHGAEREVRDGNGQTPLHTAIAEGKSDAAVLLIERGADIAAFDNNGKDALSLALQMKQTTTEEAVRMMDRILAAWQESTRKAGRTGLGISSSKAHELLSSGQLHVVKIILQAGFAADIRSSPEQRTPLWNCVGVLAPLRGSGPPGTEAAALLIDSGADVNFAHPQGLFTPMMRAVAAGRDDMLRLLLSRNADIRAKDSQGMTTLAHAATARTGIKAIQTLLDNDRQADGRPSPVMAEHLETTEHTGCTPLILALRSGRFSAAEILIREGANLRARDQHGHTALSLAAERHPISTAALILEKLGMDPSAIDAKGGNDETPLMRAMVSRNHEGARLLIKHGANVDTLRSCYYNNGGSITRRFETPLNIAVSRGDSGIARDLLEAGASLRLAFSLEDMLLENAKRGLGPTYEAVVELLEGYGVRELEEELAQKGTLTF